MINTNVPTVIKTSDMRNFLNNQIPHGSPTAMIKQLPIPKSREEETEVVRRSVQAFCDRWVPSLYGIKPGEPLYGRACKSELYRLVTTIPSLGSERTIEICSSEQLRKWVLDKPGGFVPRYIFPIVRLAHLVYVIGEVAGENRRHLLM